MGRRVVWWDLNRVHYVKKGISTFHGSSSPKPTSSLFPFRKLQKRKISTSRHYLMPLKYWVIFLLFTLAYIWFRTTGTMSSLPSYDEETMITQIATIYNLLLKLSYFNSDRVTFPPEGGHIINEELCHSLHLAPEVISLMRKVPYVINGYHKPIMWQSRAYEYLLDEEIRNGCDPELTGAADDDELRMDFLRPWEVALTS